MFNFTTQTIFNSVVKATYEQVKNKTAPRGYNLITADGKNPVMRIGNLRFNTPEIVDVYVKNHTVENLASISYDLTKVIAGETATAEEAGIYRIALYLQLSMNSQDSFYANDLVYKGKPLYVEFVIKAGDSVDNIGKRIVSNANKYLLFMAQEKILDVTYSENKVKFTGVNGYQQIKKSALQKFDPAAIKIDCCSDDGDFIDMIVGIPRVYTTDNTGAVVEVADNAARYLSEDGTLASYNLDSETPITPGIEAFADYNWMIHNLRLPTLANTYPWAINKVEQPVVGGNYTQFIIKICTDREGIAGEVVGQRATSVTTHVLYVLDNSANGDGSTGNVKEVNDALTAAGVTQTLTKADDVLKEPYRSRS